MNDSYTLSTEELTSLWQQVCEQLEPQLSGAMFGTWILSNPLIGLELFDENKAKVTVRCLTAFHANHLKKNLHDKLKATYDSILEKDCEFEFIVGSPFRPATDQKPSSTQSLATQPSVSQAGPSAATIPVTTLTTPATAPTTPVTPTFSDKSAANAANYDKELPRTHTTDSKPLASLHSPHTQPAHTHQPQKPSSFTQIDVASQSTFFSPRASSPRVEDLFSPQTLQSVALDRAIVTARQAGLRPDFTFEAFAVSSTNEMAHAAATAVSQRPGDAYNPLFLYGGVGVGKTHLMHAIGNNMIRGNPDLKVIYCTGEEFTNEIVNAIQTKKAIKFKEKYRTAHILLIDDVQFLAGKNAVQEEFFHTFNALVGQQSQIVLTSDRPPHEINLLEDRLRSRFEAGLMIDIQQPTFELRTAILLIKSRANNIGIPMDVAQLIASKVDSARKIEGIITRIRSAVELKNTPITLEMVEDILRSETDKPRVKLRVSPSDVVRTVSNHYRLKQAAVKGKQRLQPLVKARHVAMYLLKEDLNLPLTEIGRWFANRDHTSALHAVKKIELELQDDDLLQRDVSALRMSLTAISK